jgi:hypothetical protein
MTKKPKVPVRYPGRPYAELVDPAFVVELERLREQEIERIVRNLEAEVADRDQRAERWRRIKQNARIVLARGREENLQRRLKVHRDARRKLGLPEE